MPSLDERAILLRKPSQVVPPLQRASAIRGPECGVSPPMQLWGNETVRSVDSTGRGDITDGKGGLAETPHHRSCRPERKLHLFSSELRFIYPIRLIATRKSETEGNRGEPEERLQRAL
ncbi:hypothetical protein N7523_000117 [Penicillium sp. IBT 18751x]|nr:hypothetical protein N7523_000117 [Penicillium sp. IBT 18751x]